MNEPAILLRYLTPVVRAFLVNQLVHDQDAPELALVLLKPEADRESPSEIRRLLKSQLQLLATETDTHLSLITACEQIVQFALLHPEGSQEIERVNALLPEGLAFSLHSGRLLLDRERYQHSAIAQEEAYLYTPLSLPCTPPVPAAAVTVLPLAHAPEPPRPVSSESEAEATLSHLQAIRQRRMEILKKVRSEVYE